MADALSAQERLALFGPYNAHTAQIGPAALEAARSEHERLSAAGCQFLDIFDPAYPALLRECPDAPLLLYVRSGDNCYGWTDSWPAWRRVTSDEPLTGVSGLYFQLAAELLPDGGGTRTPTVTELDLHYTEQPLPLAPFTLRAEAGNGSVTLTWSYSVDDNAGGYYVYYGNKSGEYLGRVAVQGPSPVKVGNTTSITLTGLKNGTIYYFAVSAYSRIDDRINGLLSKEVYARPSAYN